MFALRWKICIWRRSGVNATSEETYERGPKGKRAAVRLRFSSLSRLRTDRDNYFVKHFTFDADRAKIAAKTAELGRVTGGDIRVEGQAWGQIRQWKNKYDQAIQEILSAHESEEALSTL